MEDFYLKVYKNHLDNICAGCKYCEFDLDSLNYADEFYKGYDGGVFCSKDRKVVSPLWKKCEQMKCAEKDDYIREMVCHLINALSDFPDNTKGKTKEQVVFNVLNLYRMTLIMYPPKEKIVYDEDFFSPLVEQYKHMSEGEYDNVMKRIMEIFKQRYYPES